MKQPDLCDVCKRAPVTTGGFLVNTNINGLLTVSIAQAESGYSQNAFKVVICGKECLTKHLMTEVEKLLGHEAAATRHPLIENPWHKDYKGGEA